MNRRALFVAVASAGIASTLPELPLVERLGDDGWMARQDVNGLWLRLFRDGVRIPATYVSYGYLHLPLDGTWRTAMIECEARRFLVRNVATHEGQRWLGWERVARLPPLSVATPRAGVGGEDGGGDA